MDGVTTYGLMGASDLYVSVSGSEEVVRAAIASLPDAELEGFRVLGFNEEGFPVAGWPATRDWSPAAPDAVEAARREREADAGREELLDALSWASGRSREELLELERQQQEEDEHGHA